MKKQIFSLSTLFIALLSYCTMNAQVPFEVSPAGHIVITAKVNGVEGKFIFDTGSGLNAVFKKFSQKIENVKTDNFFVGHRATGEELNLDLYDAKSCQIGDQHFDKQQYTIIDLDFGDIDGLISLQLFRSMPVTIDYVHKQLVFNKKVKGKKSIDIKIADYAGRAIDIFTNVILNNKVNIQVLLDSGAGKSSFWFNSKLIQPLALNKADFKIVPIKSEFKKEQQNNYYVGKLQQLATVSPSNELHNIDVTFVDGLIYEGKTSIDWIGKIITIDLPVKKIFLEE